MSRELDSFGLEKLKLLDRVVINYIIAVNHPMPIPEHYECLQEGDIGTVVDVYNSKISVVVDGKINVKSSKNIFRLYREGLDLIENNKNNAITERVEE